MPVKYSKLSDYKIKKILRKFCLELTATQAAKDIGLNRHTVDSYYNLFRQKIAEFQDKQKIKLRGHIEIDESYFGSRHFGLSKDSLLAEFQDRAAHIRAAINSPMMRRS